MKVARPIRLLALVTLLLSGSIAFADDSRARTNYLLHCMGCHGEDGKGLEGKVPSMRGTLAWIASSPRGREYLLRVPGVTQSTLAPEELAEVLNWALREFSDAKLARSVAPFTGDEVARLRSRPLLEVVATRQSIVAEPNDTPAAADR